MSRSFYPADVIVGANLRRLRMLAGLSQADIARQLGISFQQVQKYEKAQNRISAGRLWELARMLDCPVDAFFADSDPSPPPSASADRQTTRLFDAWHRLPEELQDAVLAFVTAMVQAKE